MLSRVARWMSLPKARRPIVVTAVLVVPLVAWLDYATDPVVQQDLLYVLPVVAVAWAASRPTAVIIAIYTAVAASIVTTLQTGPVTATVNDVTHLVLFLAVALLIGALRRLLDEQSHLARVDPLTQLMNRRAFEDALAHELLRAGRDGNEGTLVYFDIDGLKQINDRRGHAAGDAAIVAVADMARSCARESDLLARLGGDEFAAYLPGTSVRDADVFAERLLAGLGPGPAGTAVSLSIGMLGHPPGHSDADLLLGQADTAMYQAKQQGGGRIHHLDCPPA